GLAPRPRQAGSEPAPNRIVSSSEDNGEGPGRLLGGEGLGCACGQDDINLERNQFGRESREPLELPLGISVFDHDVAALDVTEVTQSLKEGLSQVGKSGQVARQEAYASDLDRLLRLDGERRGEEAPSYPGHDGAAPRGLPALVFWPSTAGVRSPYASRVLVALQPARPGMPSAEH